MKKWMTPIASVEEFVYILTRKNRLHERSEPL